MGVDLTFGADHAALIDGLHIRRVMGRKTWDPPVPYGANGWALRRADGRASIIVSVDVAPAADDGVLWVHASMTSADSTPGYEELTRLHQAVFRGGWAYQVFAPPQHHVNLHAHALHLWGRLDGQPALPNFGALGTI